MLTDSHKHKHIFIYVMCLSHYTWTEESYMNPTVLIPNFTKANSHEVQMKGQRDSKRENIWIFVVLTPTTLAQKNQNKSTFLTFTYHRNTYRHAHKLAFGPYVSVHAHFLLFALTVKARYRWMMGHLFSYKPQLVARRLVLAKILGRVLRNRGGTISSECFHFIFRHIPRAMKRFTNYRVIGLLGNRSLSAFVKSC